MAEETLETLDYSNKCLKKIEKATENQAKTIVTLILDDNELQRLDAIDSYTRLENLSICRNSLMRMYSVSRLTSLRSINLSNNAIITIEGLKELVFLKKLELSGNNIKSIEQLNNNINLEHLDLSGNQIAHITDISFLKYLKHLYLDKNQISHLKQCERYLPASLVTLGLAHNALTDLNTLCHLSHLEQLETITIEGNPCIKPGTGLDKIKLEYASDVWAPYHQKYIDMLEQIQKKFLSEFDYRPFVKNWVMNVKLVDGYAVNAMESLKAEWLYSQGRGRQFHEGEQEQLVQYLTSTCPKGDMAPETEEQRKLRMILSKAQHYQQQLREQGPSPPRAKHSPRMQARITGRMVSKSPDRAMSSSYHSALSNKHHTALISQHSNQMSASFSGEILSNHSLTPVPKSHGRVIGEMSPAMSQSFDSSAVSALLNPEPAENNRISEKIAVAKAIKEIELAKEEIKEIKIDSNMDSNKALNQPLEAASKMVPVPDSLMSPDYQGPLFVAQPSLIINPAAQGLMINQRRTTGTATQVYNHSNPANHSNHSQSPMVMNNHQSIVNQVQSFIPNVAIASPHSNSHSDLPVLNCSGNRNKVAAQKTNGPPAKGAVPTNMRSNKGSPQLSRSAMSSPKLRNCAEQRKGSFSSRLPQQNNEEMQSAKNLYNQFLHATPGGNSNLASKKNNGCNKTVGALSSQMEVQVTPPDTLGANSSDEDSEMCVEKLQSIKDAAYQRRKKQSVSESGSSEGVATSTTNKTGGKKVKTADGAAVTIQKLWRGYRTRNLNQKTGSIMHSIQTMRARQYIEKLSCDMEATKAALDSERKIQQLQMQAINALWKKISAMEVSCGKEGDSCPKDILSFTTDKEEKRSNKDAAVRELTQTCSMLQAQVQQLQGSMRDILQFVSNKHTGLAQQDCGGISTQTEISAVHTPQGESSGNWPYHKTASRPCSLSLTVQNNNFKQKLSQETEKSESVQTEIKENDSGTDTADKDVQLPGQTDKMSTDIANKQQNVSLNNDNTITVGDKVAILKHQSFEKQPEDGRGDSFAENLKKECLAGVASSEIFLNNSTNKES